MYTHYNSNLSPNSLITVSRRLKSPGNFSTTRLSSVSLGPTLLGLTTVMDPPSSDPPSGPGDDGLPVVRTWTYATQASLNLSSPKVNFLLPPLSFPCAVPGSPGRGQDCKKTSRAARASSNAKSRFSHPDLPAAVPPLLLPPRSTANSADHQDDEGDDDDDKDDPSRRSNRSNRFFSSSVIERDAIWPLDVPRRMDAQTRQGAADCAAMPSAEVAKKYVSSNTAINDSNAASDSLSPSFPLAILSPSFAVVVVIPARRWESKTWPYRI